MKTAQIRQVWVSVEELEHTTLHRTEKKTCCQNKNDFNVKNHTSDYSKSNSNQQSSTTHTDLSTSSHILI